MMTCKDCLHYEACKSLLEAMGYTVDGDGENADERCDTFTDRSRYMVREKGEWLHVCGKGRHAEYECSRCKTHVCFDEKIGGDIPEYNFCPNCGADMRKVENDGAAL